MSHSELVLAAAVVIGSLTRALNLGTPASRSSLTGQISELAMTDYPKPPFPPQKQPMPGSTGAMNPRPDHGEQSYKGAGRLAGKKAIIAGGDSGIGRAVAIALAREGAALV